MTASISKLLHSWLFIDLLNIIIQHWHQSSKKKLNRSSTMLNNVFNIKNNNTCSSDIFTCPKKTKVISCKLKVVCPQYTFSLPDLGISYFLVFQNACRNLTFTCPEQLGKCLCSTLHVVNKLYQHQQSKSRESDSLRCFSGTHVDSVVHLRLGYDGLGIGDPTFAPATIAPAVISSATKSKSEGCQLAFCSGSVRIRVRARYKCTWNI